MDQLEFLQIEFLENSIKSYIIFGSILLLGLLLKSLISSYLRKIIYKLVGDKSNADGKSEFDQLLKKPLNYFLLIIIFYLSFNQLNFPESWNLVSSNEIGLKMILEKGVSLLILITVFWTLLRVVDYIGDRLKFKAEKTESKVDDQLIPFAIEIGKVLVVIFGALILLSNVFNVDITALAAGLGVGGVAIALASKESLENLLGSFTIFFDKPFQVGDIITVGSITGVVEKVGFRSTRVRTFDKSLVTIPNKNLINSELDNLSLKPVRKVHIDVGLTYNTSVDQIKKIVKDIQDLVDKHPNTNQDGLVRFFNFGASSLDIMVVYFVNSPDWNLLVDTKQEINYKIIEIVKKHGSDFAFPSTSLYFENNLKS
ncbi:MAG: mechanosensitive ion channel family protein [Flavobacteriaceae bacterium]|jgi:MscS family membrane protein